MPVRKQNNSQKSKAAVPSILEKVVVLPYLTSMNFRGQPAISASVWQRREYSTTQRIVVRVQETKHGN